MALGNCAVEAIGGVTTEGLVFSLDHLSDIGSEFSMMGQEAKAVANVISACY